MVCTLGLLRPGLTEWPWQVAQPLCASVSQAVIWGKCQCPMQTIGQNYQKEAAPQVGSSSSEVMMWVKRPPLPSHPPFLSHPGQHEATERGPWVDDPYCLYWKAISAISFLRWRYTWSEKP